MEVSAKILSDIIVYNKYAKHLPDKKRRETWDEIVTRNKDMHLKKFPNLKAEIEWAYQFVYDKRVLPSMRSCQFAGKPVELNNVRLYNCSYLPIDDPAAFSEIMFLLLCGCGVGFSVQNHHIKNLPEVYKPKKSKRYLIADSIEGWADAVKMLIKSYFCHKPLPEFDFSDIRPKGALLKTSGGRAPGPEPLIDCLHNVKKILDRKESGSKLESLEIHDIVCHIAAAVLAGGIRRSSLISIFDFDDESMITCKFGRWWELNPQRALANNSAMTLRHKITKKEFLAYWKKIELSNTGDPAFMFSNDKNMATNPCAEVALKPFEFCNLCEINGATIENQDDFNYRCRAATIIGTLQASYTDFHYLRDIWKETCEKEALIGVGITGCASGTLDNLDLAVGANICLEENERIAKLIGINKAVRLLTIKPSGTSSLLLGCSSGVHSYHSKYYIRRLTVLKNEPLYEYLVKNHPELLEQDVRNPNIQAQICVPMKAPHGAITRKDETALALLRRIRRLNLEWIRNGHRKGSNYNNVSATVTMLKNEWDSVGEWVWDHREEFTAISFFPEDLGTHIQTPFEEINKETYEKMLKPLSQLDLTQIEESDDITSLKENVACAGGACEII